jgi:SAM-dependent methyltransferase
VVWAVAALGIWSGALTIPLPGVTLVFPLAGTGLGFGIGCTFMGLWMIWDSKIGKERSRERLLDRVRWTGSENVLDVGCGRGLILVAAARRLTTGRAIGIDIWQGEDLSQNRPDAPLENARREGVADRVDVETADMRKMPFASNTFDFVVSRAAIHNLYDARDRASAIAEIVRVMKPGGQAVIEDIRHLQQYEDVFAEQGCSEIVRVGSWLAAFVLMLFTFGSLRPGALIVRKPA